MFVREKGIVSFLFLIFLPFLLFSQCSQAIRPLYFKEHWNRNPGQAGIRIRLSKKGINQLKEVGVRLLNERISRLSGYSTSHPISQPGLEGNVLLSNIRVLRFSPAQISVVNFLPPRFIIFGLENMAVSIAGDFFGQAGLFQVSGQTEGVLNGLTVALTSELLVQQDGSMIVKVPNCSTIIQRSHFNLHPEGPLGPIIKTFEGHINNVLREKIPALLCRKLQSLVEKNSPKLFRKLTKTQLNDKIDPKVVSESTITQSFILNIMEGLYIDNANIAPPLVTYDYFETQQKGEIRYDDSNPIQTPFYPRYMNVTTSSDRMMYFFGSDYLFNSLLFHAYERNKLTLRLDKDNVPEQYKDALSTSCSSSGSSIFSSICVGRLLPGVAAAFPNSTTSFVLVPHTMPDFSFNGESAAVGLNTRILSYVNDGKKERQMMVASAEGQADVILHADSERLFGEIKLNKLAVHLHRAAVPGIDPTSVEELSPLAKTFIGPQLSSRLKKGMPFPLKDSVTLLKPTMRIDDGFIELSTDFLINENALRAKIDEQFAKLDF